MTTEQQELLAEVFETAREAPPEERRRILRERLASNPDVMQEAARLLEAHDRNRSGFLEVPALGSEFTVLGIGVNEPPEPLPERIGPYRILSLLSEGDTALVYEGEQEAPVLRRAAIKVLRSASQRRDILKRFESERQAVAMMEHPHIARFYDAGTTGDGRAYFAMEHAGGQPITSFASALTVREKLALFIQVCLGVEHAHQRGIIHRDLKPSNILVCDARADAQAKIIDFGVAKAIGGTALRTLTGHLMGTPAYMSPEQLAGRAGIVDTRSDVYALGVVFYEVLAGRPAFDFDALGPAGGVAAITAGDVAPIRKVHPGIPGDVTIIIRTAMSTDPGHRYQTVRELRADIERFLAGRPIDARDPGPVYIAWKLLCRHRLVALVVAMALAVSGAALWYAHRADHVRFQTATEMARGLLGRVVSMSRTVGLRSQRGPLVQGLLSETERIYQLDPSDPTLMSMRADSLCAAGDVDQEHGRIAQAKEHLVEAYALRQQLASNPRATLGQQMDLSIAIVRLGDIAKDEHDLDAAERLYLQAFEMDKKVARSRPGLVRAQNMLAWSYERLGSLAGQRGNLDAALEMYEKQLDIMLGLCDRTRDVDIERGTAVAYSQCASVWVQKNDVGRARLMFATAAEHAQRAVEIAPDNQIARRVVVGLKLAQVNCPPEGLSDEERRDLVDDAITRAEDLRSIDPEDPDTLSLAASAGCFAMSDALGRGDVELALRRYRAALSAAKRLAVVSPGAGADNHMASILENGAAILAAARTRGLIVGD